MKRVFRIVIIAAAAVVSALLLNYTAVVIRARNQTHQIIGEALRADLGHQRSERMAA